MNGIEYLVQLNEASSLCLIIGGCFAVFTVILCFALRIPEIVRNITGRAMKMEIRRHRMGLGGTIAMPSFFRTGTGDRHEPYWNTTSGKPAENDDSGETTALPDGADMETSVLPEGAEFSNKKPSQGSFEETSVLEDGERSIVLMNSDNSLI